MIWLVFFAVPLTESAVMPLPAAVPRPLPVMDTILSWTRSLKANEPTPPKLSVLTLTPAATDTMLVCTSANAFTLPAFNSLLLAISALNLLVILPMAKDALTAVVLPPDPFTATFTIVLPAGVPKLSLVF